MASRLRSKIQDVWSHLSRLGEGQPLHRAALVVLLLLDVFILVSIVQGLEEHTDQLADPWDRVPVECRDVVLEGAWGPTARLDKLDDATHRASGAERAPDLRRKPLHPICAALIEPLEAVSRDPALAELLARRHRLRAEVRELEAALSGPKAAYDTALLGQIAREPGAAAVPAIAQDLREKTTALEAARAQLAALDAALSADPKLELLRGRIDAVREEDRRRLADDLRSLQFWFPMKRLGMRLAFLLPPFLAFWAWNGASLRRRRGVQTLVSSHLVVVSFLPILWELGEAVYDVLPKRLLRALLELLAAWNLAALWHYGVIALAVATALLVVHGVQRRFFSWERLLERRIAKGQCQDCGKPLPAGARACVFCGFSQYEPCPRCGRPAHVRARHCPECGAERPAASPAVDPGTAGV
jgi:hypothetical protein